MEDFQQRLMDEKKDLDLKSSRLEAFTLSETFTSLQAEDKNLLLIQLSTMTVYSGILLARIGRFQE